MNEAFQIDKLIVVTPNILTAMDPRLQLAVSMRRAGETRLATASTDINEIGVIASTSDVDAWFQRTDIREPCKIGVAENGNTIVTGRIDVHRIESIRTLPFVKSLKAGIPLRPMLNATTTETNSEPSQLPAGHSTNGGNGVVVGIIDYGGDFAHENFRHANGTTRLSVLWDQNGGNTPSSPFGYGKEYGASTLNLALNHSNPYASIGYDPAIFDDGSGSHGTHVMDIAAGNGRGSGVPGMAPEAELIFVNVTHEKDPTGTGVVGNSFGDSVTLLESLRYIFDKSGNKPCVINVSLGTNGGPHDGSTMVEQGIDAMVTETPNRAVVIAASNSYDDGIHAAGKVTMRSPVSLEWELNSNLRRAIEMEIWYSGADRFKVELVAPNGTTLLAVSPGTTQQLMSGTMVAVLIANRLDDSNNHDNMIGIFFAAGMPSGKYVVRLTGISITDGSFHAWIERDNYFQSRFSPPHDNAFTLGSISCGKHLIAVGSYDAHLPSKPLSYFTSAGPTRDGRQKPEVSAPGHNVWAAKSGTRTGVTRMSGTSMAAPAVAGHVALIFSEAVSRGLSLTIDQTKSIVEAAARSNPPTGANWHPRFGKGRIDSAKAIQAVIDLSSNGNTSNSSSRTPKLARKSNNKPQALKSKPVKGRKKKRA